MRLRAVPRASLVADYESHPINWDRVEGFQETIRNGFIMPALQVRRPSWSRQVRVLDGRHRLMAYEFEDVDPVVVQQEYDHWAPGRRRFYPRGTTT